MMKANELIRWFGIDAAKEKLNNWSKDSDFEFDFDDLKRLVESRELVELTGGLDMAKSVLDIEIHEPYYNYDAKKVTMLSIAIADVESCQ